MATGAASTAVVDREILTASARMVKEEIDVTIPVFNGEQFYD